LERDPFIDIDEYEAIYIKGDEKNMIMINSKSDNYKKILYNDQYERKILSFQNLIFLIFFNYYLY
jgi:hypothetical protein